MTNDTEARKAFEKKAAISGYHINRAAHNPLMYEDPITNYCWSMYQAGRESMQAEIADLRTTLAVRNSEVEYLDGEIERLRGLLGEAERLMQFIWGAREQDLNAIRDKSLELGLKITAVLAEKGE